MTPDEARKDCWCESYRKPCEYHEGYQDGYEAAQRDLKGPLSGAFLLVLRALDLGASTGRAMPESQAEPDTTSRLAGGPHTRRLSGSGSIAWSRPPARRSPGSGGGCRVRPSSRKPCPIGTGRTTARAD